MKNIFNSIFNNDSEQKIVLPKSSSPLLRSLEPRVLLDAAAAETSMDIADKAILEQQAAEYIEAHDASDTVENALDADAIAPPLERDRRNEIVFIDGGVENKAQIIADIDPSVEIIVLDQGADGVEQIAAALEGRGSIDAIHIISHGDVGALSLGSTTLTQESITGEHADELAIIRDVLTESGDILIYGCNFGQGEEGQEAARALSLATGADIAASDDLTGAESGGGDWDLELHAGEVETQSLEARGFEGVLAGISQDAPETEIGVENTSVVFSNANGNAPSLASNIGTTATVTLTSTNGTLSLSSTNGLSFTAGDGADDTSLTFNGLITNINAALDGLTFKPNADFAGDAEIQMDSVAGVEDIHLATNHGFEEPDRPTESISFRDDIEVPGWSTTDVKGQIEIWNAAGGVIAFEGDQFIEINANSAGTLSQTVSVPKETPLTFSFAHRGRAGVDTVHAKLTDYGADGILGTDDDKVEEATFSTDKGAWKQHEIDFGTASGDKILIEMTAVSSASTSNAAGNFLDAVDLRITDPDTTASSKIVVAIQVDTDGDGISNIDDIDDDNDGILDINEQIEFANGGRLTVGQRVETFGPHSQLAPSSIDQTFTGVEGNTDNQSIGETQTYNFDLPIADVSFGVRSLHHAASYGNFTVTYADGTVDNNVAFTIKDPADYTAEELAFAVDNTANTGGTIELVVDADGNNVVSTSDTTNQGSGILLFNTDPERLVTSISLTNLSDPSTAINSNTRVNIFSSPTFIDWDQDGIADSVDLDSDNDGISDAHESGFVVAEQARLQAIIDDDAASAADKTTATDRLAKLSEIFADGTITEQESSDYLSIGAVDADGDPIVVAGDADNDGLMDIFDANTNDSDRTESVGTTPIDSDGDGVANFIDLDSDGDGIADAIEARTTAGFIANDGTDASNADADGDGVLDIFDTNSTFGGTDGNFNAPVDTDKDGTADYLDLDSDNDTITDSNEGLQSPETLTYENPDGSASSSNGLANVLENEHGNTDELAYREIGVVAANDTATTNEDTTLTVNEQNGLLANDESTAELAITSFSVGTQTVNAGESITLDEGTITVNSEGNYTFVPAANFHGTVPTITYTVEASIGELVSTTTATLAITVTPVNDIPTVNPGTNGAGGPGAGTDDENDPLGNQSSNDHDTVSIDVKPNFTDNDTEDTLTYTATGLPEGLSIVNGVIQGTIDSSASQGGPDGNGVYTVSVTADDGNGGTVTDTFTYTVANPVPVANDDTATGPEDGGAVTGSVLSNDTDADSVDDGDDATTEDTIKVVSFIVEGQEDALVAGETATIDGVGTIKVNADGTYEFTPEEDFNGAVPAISYTIEDSDGAKDTADLNITITPTNDEPVAVAGEDTGVDGQAITPIDPSQLFSDVDGDELTIVVDETTLPPGLFIDPLTGNIAGTLDTSASTRGPNNDGVYEIKITADDDGDPSTPPVETTLTYTVTNPAPVAVDDNISVNEDTPATGNLLANDSDDDILTVTGFTIDGVTGDFAPGDTAIIPGKGTITIDAEGNYTFTPEPNYNGPVPNITYNVVDADGLTAEADLKITVSDVNDPPVIVTTEEGGTDPLPAQSDSDGDTVSIQTSGNFSDADNDTLSYTATGLPAGLSIDPATGEITGTLDSSASQGGDNPETAPGVYTVLVTASDGMGGIVTDSFTYTVDNPAPVADDDSVSVKEDSDVVGNLLANDKDSDGDDLTITDFSIPGVEGPFVLGEATTIPGVGTITINENGSYVFSPVENYNGDVPDIVYTVSDGEGGTDTATLDITVTPKNDDPNVVTTEEGAGGPGPGTNDPNDPLGNESTVDGTEIQPIDVTSNFNDVDGDNLTYSVGENDLPPGLTIDPMTGIISGTVSADASQGGPNKDGVYTVTVTADDGKGGEPVSDTFTYTVGNPAPTATADSITVNEDTPATGNVLANDSDVDGDKITVTEFIVAGQTTPIAAGETATIPGVGTVTIGSDGSYTFTPVKDFNGDVPTITYTIDDGQGGTATAPLDIKVAPVNDAPVVVTNDGDDPLADASNVDGTTIQTIDVAPNFTDVDGNSLTFDATGLPPGLSISDDGKITGTLDKSASQGGPNGSGIYSITVIADDGKGGTVTDTFTYTVTNPPIEVHDDTGNVQEDATELMGNVLGNDLDPDGDTVTVTSFVIDGVSHLPGATVELINPEDPNESAGTIILGSDGAYTFVPAENYDGTVPPITYAAQDADGSTLSANLNITIHADNDVPTVVTSLEDIFHDDLTNLNGDNAINIADNFADVEGSLTFSTPEGSLPDGLTLNPDGTITGVIVSSASQGGLKNDGVYVITVTAEDSAGATVTDTFKFTVANPVPEAGDDTGNTNEGVTLTVDAANGLLSNDKDADSVDDNDPDTNEDTLTITSFTIEGQTTAITVGEDAGGEKEIPGVGTITINKDGSYNFVPFGDFNGDVPTITYTVTDTDGATATADLTIKVTPVNDAPQLVDGASLSKQSAVDNQEIDPIDLSTLFTDVDDTALKYTAENLPDGLEIDEDTGVITGTPVKNASQNSSEGEPAGTYEVTIVVTDDDGAKVEKTFTYTVANPVPVAVNESVQIDEDTPAMGDLLRNDSDPDGDALSISEIKIGDTTIAVPTDPSTPAEHNIDGVGKFEVASDGSYTFTPAENYTGEVPKLTYTVKDADGATKDATLDITIKPVNDSPSIIDPATGEPGEPGKDGSASEEDPVAATDDATPGDEPLPNRVSLDGDMVSFNTADNFGDVDTDKSKLMYSATGLPSGLMINPKTGEISGTIENYASGQMPDGIYEVTITVDDGKGGTVSDTFNYTVGNPEPDAVDHEETTAKNKILTGNVITDTNDDGEKANDPDKDVLTVSGFTVEGVDGNFEAGDTAIIEGKGTIKINLEGSYVFTPEPGFSGEIPAIEFTIVDANGAEDKAELNIEILNATPTLIGPAAANGGLPPISGTDSEVTAPIDLSSHFADADGDKLTYNVEGLPAGLSVDPQTGLITGTLNSSASQGGPQGNGSYPVTVTVDDGDGGTITTTFIYTVDNPAPESEDANNTVNQGDVATGNVLAGASDLDGDELTVSEFTVAGGTYSAGETANIPNVGTVVINADGSYVFTPLASYSGSAPAIGFTVRDADGAISQSTLTINIVPTATGPGEPIRNFDRETPDAGFEPIEVDGIILKTVQEFQDLNRDITFEEFTPENNFERGINDQLTASIFSTGTPTAMIGDVLTIDIGQFDQDALIADGLVNEQTLADVAEDEPKLQLFVNTFVRQQILFVDISSNREDFQGTKNMKYKVTTLDGKKLPEWVQLDDNGFLIIESPLNVKSIDLLITAELEDGTSIQRAITVESLTGVINMASAEDVQKVEKLSDGIKQSLANTDQDLL